VNVVRVVNVVGVIFYKNELVIYVLVCTVCTVYSLKKRHRV
jgi:hypothetical protein